MSTNWSPSYPWEKRRSQDVTSGAARYENFDTVTLVDEEEKKSNLGEKKSYVKDSVKELTPEISANTAPRVERNRENRWGLDEETKNMSKEECKARFEEAVLELKRVVPVATRFKWLMGMIPMLGCLIASSLFLVCGGLWIEVTRLSREHHDDEAHHLQSIADTICLSAFGVTILTQITLQFVLLKPLQKRMFKMYEERYLLSSAQLAALGCTDLEDREQKKDDGLGVDGWIRQAILKRSFEIVLPWPKLELGIWVAAPFLAVLMYFAS